MDYKLALEKRAANGTRTRDLDLGKVALYQLSYCRVLALRKCISLNAVAKVMLFRQTPKHKSNKYFYVNFY